MFFFFNDTATTEIYTLSLHDALPISNLVGTTVTVNWATLRTAGTTSVGSVRLGTRSEEHTSELQSHVNLVCRLLLEKKKKNKQKNDLYLHLQLTFFPPGPTVNTIITS